IYIRQSLAPQARKRLGNFVKAEKLGRNCGDCGIYFSLCPRSIFTNPSAGIRFSNACNILIAFMLEENFPKTLLKDIYY
ncbi:hypothetical protein Avbf_12202, partial [Armadillidium vulgare]